MLMPTTSLFLRWLLSGPRREYYGLGILFCWTWYTNTAALRLTDFNVAISVISLFFLLAKLIGFIMKIWFPLVATIISFALTALYAVSTYGQIGPDYTDDRYPSPAAWYFRFGCDLAKPHGVYSSCQIAQSSLGVTFYML